MKKSLFFSSLLLLLFSIFTYLYIDPNYIYLKSLFTGFAYSYRFFVSGVYFLFISILFAFYGSLLRQKKPDPILKKEFLIIPILGILAYPAALSFDIFNYIATAKVLFTYFENPYIIMPIQFTGDKVLLFTHAANKIALYGPLWIFLTGIPYYLSFGNYLLSVIVFKIFVSLFYVGMVYLIYKTTKSLYNTLYFAASPLVVIETFVSGHNDVVMMFFALASVYALIKNKKCLSFIFLIGSILIKYATIFLIPGYLYYLYKSYKKEEINLNIFYAICFIGMLTIFFLSPIREEIYPWYAIWPLTFISLFAERNKVISGIFSFFTFCLMLRYIPFMLFGTYFGITPPIKIFVTFIPTVFLIIFILFKKRLKLI